MRNIFILLTATLILFLPQANYANSYDGIVDRICDYQSNKVGFSILCQAVEKNDIEVVEILLRSGFDPDEESSNEVYPIEIAMDSDNVELTDLLLTYGADPHVLRYDEKNKSYTSPIYRAIINKSYSILEVLVNHEVDFSRRCLEEDISYKEFSGYEVGLLLKDRNILVILFQLHEKDSYESQDGFSEFSS